VDSCLPKIFEFTAKDAKGAKEGKIKIITAEAAERRREAQRAKAKFLISFLYFRDSVNSIWLLVPNYNLQIINSISLPDP
jgi:hypothetical protein